MEINQLNYNPNNCNIKLMITVVKEYYGTVSCKAVFNVNEDELYISGAYVTGMRIPHNEHVKLLHTLKEDEILKEYIRMNCIDYLNNLGKEYTLALSSAFVLSADTKYIRKVLRNGRNLSNITEYQEEQHDICIMLGFSDIDKDIKVNLKYNRQKGYQIKFDKDDKKYIQEYLVGDWKQTLLRDILEKIQGKIYFLLPDL